MTPTKTRREKFTEVFRQNAWHGDESVSGTGSDLAQTARLRELLPKLARELGVTSLIDAPCGDLHWMKDVPWESMGVFYTGIDIVPDLVERLRATHRERQFICADLVTEVLPMADLIFCRDCLVHLPVEEVKSAVRNFAKSGATWLLTTTFPESGTNTEVRWSGWRPINLQEAPFHLPAPVKLINEGCTEDGGKYADKSLGLWRLADLSAI